MKPKNIKGILSLSVDADLIRKLDGFALQNEMNRSRAAEYLIDKALQERKEIVQ